MKITNREAQAICDKVNSIRRENAKKQFNAEKESKKQKAKELSEKAYKLVAQWPNELDEVLGYGLRKRDNTKSEIKKHLFKNAIESLVKEKVFDRCDSNDVILASFKCKSYDEIIAKLTK